MSPKSRYGKLTKLKRRIEEQIRGAEPERRRKLRLELRVIEEEVRIAKLEMIKLRQARDATLNETKHRADTAMAFAAHEADVLPAKERQRFWRRLKDGCVRRRIEAMQEQFALEQNEVAAN